MNEQQKLELYARLAEKIGALALPIVMNANLEPDDFPQILAAACAISIVQLHKKAKIAGESTAVMCLNSIVNTLKRNGVPFERKAIGGVGAGSPIIIH